MRQNPERRHGSRTSLRALRWQDIMERAVILAIVWAILTGGHAASWPLGLASISFALLLSLQLSPPSPRQFSYAGLPRFIGYFLFYSLKGGMQVAAIALRPRLDLQPGILEIELRLPDETSRVLLTCILGLLPGTLCMELQDRQLRLHVLDRRLAAEQDIRSAEDQVARLLRCPL